MNQDSIQRLRSLPIEQVADALGMGVRRHVALCPFHDDSHPSLHFSRKSNTYHCYVCNAHGSTIDLVMHRLNLSFPEACRWLAQAFGIWMPELDGRDVREGDGRWHQSADGAALRADCPKVLSKQEPEPQVDAEYLSTLVASRRLSKEATSFLYDERRLDPAIIDWCRIGSITEPMPCRRYGRNFYDAPSLLIPYFDSEWRLLSVQSRYLGEHKPEVPRFRFPKGSQCHIYNLQVLGSLGAGEPLLITEGCSDCWSMLSTYHKAIAIPSATLLKPSDILPLKPLRLYMFPDADAPGERLYLQLKELLPQLRRLQMPEGFKDFSDWYVSLCAKGRSRQQLYDIVEDKVRGSMQETVISETET